MSKIQLPATKPKRRPWNRGRLVGQKRPLFPSRFHDRTHCGCQPKLAQSAKRS